MPLRDPARAILVVLESRGPMRLDELEARVPGARDWLPGMEAAGQVVRVGEGWGYQFGLD